MTITRHKHRQVVSRLWSAIFMLATIILALVMMETNLFTSQSPLEYQMPTTSSPVYLRTEEAVVIHSTSTNTLLPVTDVGFQYVLVVNSCGPHYDGGVCLNVRSGPGPEYSVVSRLRNGTVLKVGGQVERDGMVWYKIIFDEWLRYPERITSDWYVAANFVEILYNEGDRTIWENGSASTTDKSIVVDRSLQKLYAYDGDTLFMETSISTGLALTPTPRGTFTVFKKTPSRYMQGPLPDLPNDQVYDLPGVPWNLYFTHDGAVIHGTYWHDSFGNRYSHGCVNLWPEDARKLYTWADLGTTVTVRD